MNCEYKWREHEFVQTRHLKIKPKAKNLQNKIK